MRILVVLFSAGVVIGQLSGGTVVLDYGTFQGSQTNGVASFLGIRFADPPVGNLRWRPPVTPPSSKLGVVNATTLAPTCIAVSKGSTSIPSGQSEDCLYANIYAPVGAPGLVPVLAYFHGGGFASGSTHGVTPTYMMPASTKPYVFVTFEYRLGAFGFLSGTEVPKDGTYNVGMLDQRVGLQWIQRYISQFGGDASQVSIWGQSAGAGATMFHLIANNGDPQGLFHRAMGDSPSLSFMPAVNSAYDQALFADFTSSAGCSSASSIMNCLRNASSTVLATAGNKAAAFRSNTLYSFAPRVGGSFLPSAPVEAFKSGRFARVPVFFGGNTDEGANWSAGLPSDANTSSANATEDTVYNFLQGQFNTLTRASFNNALALYPLTDYNGSFSLQGQQMYGEMRYICSPNLVTQYAAGMGQPAYAYHYNNGHLGSKHGAELDALFSPPAAANAADTALFMKQRQYWTSFVTSGTPVAANATVWQRVQNSDGSPRIRLDPTGVVMENISSAQTARCDFWHGISQELNT